MAITVGAIEAYLAIAAFVIIVPVVQVVTLRVGFNGLRTDVRETKAEMTEVVGKVTNIEKWIAIREDREGAA